MSDEELTEKGPAKDLHLISELLLMAKVRDGLTWEQLEASGSVYRDAMNRLRWALQNDEIEVISAGIASYLGEI